MNPDSDINVVAVFPDGLVKIYGWIPSGGSARPLVGTKQFTNYGRAKDYADTYEEKERIARKARSR